MTAIFYGHSLRFNLHGLNGTPRELKRSHPAREHKRISTHTFSSAKAYLALKESTTMRTTVLITCLLSSFFAFAQEDPPKEIQAEIDETFWVYFQKAFETLDGDLLNSLYAAQVLRVTPAGIDTDNQFKIFNATRFDQNKADGATIRLDFWFDSRHTNRTTSYEVGFYRIQIRSSAEVETFYGQFHVVLKKIGDDWKIVQDWDATSIAGEEITAAQFSKRAPAQF
jgi:hypothetical protein